MALPVLQGALRISLCAPVMECAILWAGSAMVYLNAQMAVMRWDVVSPVLHSYQNNVSYHLFYSSKWPSRAIQGKV